jgi:hypothetical protein
LENLKRRYYGVGKVFIYDEYWRYPNFKFKIRRNKKIKTITTLLLCLCLSAQATPIIQSKSHHQWLPAPTTEVLSVKNGTYYLKTTLGTKEAAYSYGYLDGVDTPSINKYKRLDKAVYSSFQDVNIKNTALRVKAGKIVDKYAESVTVGNVIKVTFVLKDSYLKHGRHLSRNPIHIAKYGVNGYRTNNINLEDDLVSKNFAKYYYGGPREEWTKDELLYIINRYENQ